MKKIKLIIGPSLFLFSTLASAIESDIVLTKGMSGEISTETNSVTIISKSGEPIILNAQTIREQMINQNGIQPYSELEIQIHDENDEIIITDRSRIIIHTDISELRQCCVNGIGPGNTRSLH